MTLARHDSRGFDATALERSYAFLEECPEHLLTIVIALPTKSFGDLRERVRGVVEWREALLEGRLPPDDIWPPPEIAAPVRQALDQKGLVRFCKGQPELVDEQLKDILAAFSGQGEAIREEVARRLYELEGMEREKLREREDWKRRIELLKKTLENEKRALPAEKRRKSVVPDEKTRRRLRDQAERDVLSRPRDADAGLIETWGERARLWNDVADIFGDLGQMLGRGWDLTLGVLHHVGWRDVLRLRELVERLPDLREVVRTLGRLHVSETAESVAERVFLPMRRLEEERREVPTPLVPADTRGIERSGSVARMLPVEAAMLGHPKLKMLWHARRAERALLAYRVEGVEDERTLVERETMERSENRRPALERGPILAIVDTSGSMHGLPEQVAKALVLEALRTAHAEKRRCRLYSFSGPGQVVEHELGLSPEGIAGLLEFLAFSFGGGSDPTEAAARVLKQLREGAWSKADVLFVSDGEWPVPADLMPEVQRAREAGTRFHGIQIGNRGRTGLHKICEPVHVFTDWLGVAGGG